MIREQFGKLGRWIAAKSAVGRLAVLVGAVVLFMIAQQVAMVSNAAENGSATVEAVTGLIALVLVIVALYAAYAVIRSFVSGRGKSGESTNGSDSA